MTRQDDRIDRTIELGAPPERVWRALTTPAEIAAWFHVTIDGPLTPGGEVWMTHEHKRFRVKVVEMDPPRRFAWDWHPGGVDPAVDYSREPRTRVTFTLEPTPGGTRLIVSETGFTAVSLERRARVFSENSRGWIEVLSWFKTYVETH